MTDKEHKSGNDAGAVEGEQAAEATVEQPDGTPAEAELEALRQEAKTNLEGWQRSLAEFQNYKRRVEREMKESYQNATLDMLTSLLPIIDDFERALANVPDGAENQAWLEGIALIHRKFLKLLEDHHVEAIDPVGEPFDPNRHQALGRDESSELESGHVSTVVQKGYAAGDKVLRPALVKVAP